MKHFRQLFVAKTMNLTLVLTFGLNATYRRSLEDKMFRLCFRSLVVEDLQSICCPQMASLLYKKILPFSFPFFMQGLCDVTPEGYHHLTKLLMNLANGKVVVALEVKQFTTL